MFSSSKNNIVVTIGNQKTIITSHDRIGPREKFLIEELNDDAKKKLNIFFAKNRRLPIYVLLDTTDQSYKRKQYPNIHESRHTIKRDLAAEGTKNVVTNYVILKNVQEKLPNQKINIGKMDCLLISAPLSENTLAWLDLLTDMPNRIVGIYMVPIEVQNVYNIMEKKLAMSLKKEELAKKKPTSPSPKTTANKNNIYYFTLQTRSSGTRQIVLSKHGVIFTRIINLNFSQSNFVAEYEKDVHSTFEYLRRILPNLKLSDLKIINVLPEVATNRLKTLADSQIHIKNYSPHLFAKEIGYEKLLPADEEFCDILVSRIFSQGKKCLKFVTPKITLLEKFFLGVRSFFYANVIAVIALTLTAGLFLYNNRVNDGLLENEMMQKTQAIQELAKFKESLLQESQGGENFETGELDKVIEIGKIDDILGPLSEDFTVFYNDISFLRDFQVKLKEFTYTNSSFNAKEPSANSTYAINLSGRISNESGDIEDFFKKFDAMDRKVKESLAKYDVRHSELPRNIDFTQKYYDFQIDFKISKKQ